MGRNLSKRKHKKQALMNCSLTSELREETFSLKQFSTRQAFRKIKKLLSVTLDKVMPHKHLNQLGDKQRAEELFCEKKQRCFQAYLKSNTDNH